MRETEKKEATYNNIEKWDTNKLLEELLQSQNKSFIAVKNSLKDIEFAVSSSIKKLAWTLLTNRVHPSRHTDSGIQELRSKVGDLVIQDCVL